MTEATNLIINYAFKNLKLRRIQASVMRPNTASMNVLLKNKFEFVSDFFRNGFKKIFYR